jgi:hypothetical protein
MIRPDEAVRQAFHKEKNAMKKLMTLMLGLCLAMGTVAVSFADDQPKTEKKKGKKGGKKGKKEGEAKKEGGR